MPPAPILRRVNTQSRLVALTFDDGPHPDHTMPKLEILRQYEATATFFLLGQQAARHPHIKAAIAGGGHELGSHSHTHARLTSLGMTGIRTELSRARAAIGPHSHFRPPYGAFNQQVQRAAGEMGYPYLVLWNVDPRDWSGIGPSAIVAGVLAHVAPGAIVVLHDLARPTVDALPGILAGLRARDISAVTLSQLLAAGTPSV
jgi:peptidoglycan/xylan/chitin deacetylase (PgdA/CDA1 family)